MFSCCIPLADTASGLIIDDLSRSLESLLSRAHNVAVNAALCNAFVRNKIRELPNLTISERRGGP